MKKILAVSGGVDSMLLLWRFRNDKGVVVAHFNHGTRESADADAELVRKTAEKYGLEFFYEKAELGADVSEADARKARYDFLYKVQKKMGEDSVIVTAHHLNDLAESVAINFMRGTGWRGLTPFSDTRIQHPFIEDGLTKIDILKEAAKNGIIYRQDPTNVEDNYLRNRLRASIANLNKIELMKIYELYKKQMALRYEIEEISAGIVNEINEDESYPREIFRELDDDVVMEILRKILMQNNLSLTRPQMVDFLSAIRNYLPGKKFNLPGDRMVVMKKKVFKF